MKKLGRDSRDSLFCCGIIDKEKGFLTLAPKIIEFFKGEEGKKVFFASTALFLQIKVNLKHLLRDLIKSSRVSKSGKKSTRMKV